MKHYETENMTDVVIVFTIQTENDKMIASSKDAQNRKYIRSTKAIGPGGEIRPQQPFAAD